MQKSQAKADADAPAKGGPPDAGPKQPGAVKGNSDTPGADQAGHAKWLMPPPEDTVQMYTVRTLSEDVTPNVPITTIAASEMDVAHIENLLVSNPVVEGSDAESHSAASEARDPDQQEDEEVHSDDDAARGHIQAAITYTSLQEATLRAAPCTASAQMGTLSKGAKFSVDGQCSASPGVWARVVNSRGTQVRGWVLSSTSAGLTPMIQKLDPGPDLRLSDRPPQVQAFVRQHCLNTVVTSALLELGTEQQKRVMEECASIETWENKNALIMHSVRVASGEELSQEDVKRLLAAPPVEPAGPPQQDSSPFNETAASIVSQLHALMKAGDKEALRAHCKSTLPNHLRSILSGPHDDELGQAVEACRRSVADATGLTGEELDTHVVSRLYALCLWMVAAQADAEDSHNHVSPLMKNWSRQSRRSLREREKMPVKRECPACGAKVPEPRFDEHFAVCHAQQPAPEQVALHSQHRRLRAEMMDALYDSVEPAPIQTQFASFDGTWRVEGDGHSPQWCLQRPQVAFHHSAIGKAYRITDVRWRGNRGLTLKLTLNTPPEGWSQQYLLCMVPSATAGILLGRQLDVNTGKETSFQMHITTRDPPPQPVVLSTTLSKGTGNVTGLECAGSYVTQVRRGSTADEVGLTRGCRMLSVAGRVVSNADDVDALLATAPEQVDVTFAPSPVRVQRIIHHSPEVRRAARESFKLKVVPVQPKPPAADTSEARADQSSTPPPSSEVGTAEQTKKRPPSAQRATLVPQRVVDADDEVMSTAASVTARALAQDCAWAVSDWRAVYDDIKQFSRPSCSVYTLPSAFHPLQGRWLNPAALVREVFVEGLRAVLHTACGAADEEVLCAEGDTVRCRGDGMHSPRACVLEWGGVTYLLQTATVVRPPAGAEHLMGSEVDVTKLTSDGIKAEVRSGQDAYTISTTCLANAVHGLRLGQPAVVSGRYGIVTRLSQDTVTLDCDGEAITGPASAILPASSPPVVPLSGFLANREPPVEEETFCDECGCFTVAPEFCTVCRLWDHYSDKPYREIREECKRLNLRSFGTTENLCKSLLQHFMEMISEAGFAAVAAAALAVAASAAVHGKQERGVQAYVDLPLHPVACKIFRRIRSDYPTVRTEGLAFFDTQHPQHGAFCRKLVDALVNEKSTAAEDGIEGWWVYGRHTYSIEQREECLHFRQPGMRIAGFLRLFEGKVRRGNVPPPDMPLTCWLLDNEGAKLWLALDDDGKHVRSCFVNQGVTFSEVAQRISSRAAALSRGDIVAVFVVPPPRDAPSLKRKGDTANDDPAMPKPACEPPSSLSDDMQVDEIPTQVVNSVAVAPAEASEAAPSVGRSPSEVAAPSPVPDAARDVHIEYNVDPKDSEPSSLTGDLRTEENTADNSDYGRAQQCPSDPGGREYGDGDVQEGELLSQSQSQSPFPPRGSEPAGRVQSLSLPTQMPDELLQAQLSKDQLAAMFAQLKSASRGMRLLSIDSMQQPTEKLTWPPDSGPIPPEESDRSDRGLWSTDMSQYVDIPSLQYTHPHSELHTTLSYVATVSRRLFLSTDCDMLMHLLTMVLDAWGAPRTASGACVLVMRAEAFMGMRLPACALHDLDRALSGEFSLEEDVKARALRLRGYAHRRLGRWAEAVVDLRAAHSIERLNSKWRTMYGRVAEIAWDVNIDIGYGALDEEVMGGSSGRTRNVCPGPMYGANGMSYVSQRASRWAAWRQASQRQGSAPYRSPYPSQSTGRGTKRSTSGDARYGAQRKYAGTRVRRDERGSHPDTPPVVEQAEQGVPVPRRVSTWR